MSPLAHAVILILSTTSTVLASPSIIIVGAGSSGIGAATRLLENNFTNLKVLEAEPRIGGRIQSVQFGNAIVDLGAEWCDGQAGNLVYDIVKNMNLVEPTKVPTDIYLSSKLKLEKEFASELFAIFDELQNPTTVTGYERNQTLGGYCQEHYPKIVHKKYGKNLEKLKIAENAIDLLKLNSLLMRGGFAWSDPALITDHKSAEGDHTLNWKGKGFKTFLDVIMRKYPDSYENSTIEDKILLNKEVTQITWKTDGGKKQIHVICSDNSTYSADHVIFTPSIGALKHIKDSMFSPKLPIEKQRAIQDIGIAAMVRVVMYFPEEWWGDSAGFFFLWTEKDKHSILQEFPEGPKKNGQSWLTSLLRVYKQDSRPNILMANFIGDFVPEIEVLPGDFLVEGIYFVLEKFLSRDYNVTKPDRILRSNWYSNPHFRGSYSFQTISSRRENGKMSAEEKLAESLKNDEGKPVLQFAGEATNVFHYASVQGAVESGYREADILMSLYK